MGRANAEALAHADGGTTIHRGGLGGLGSLLGCVGQPSTCLVRLSTPKRVGSILATSARAAGLRRCEEDTFLSLEGPMPG